MDRDHLNKFPTPFNSRFHMKFEENSPKGFRGEVVQRCGRKTDAQSKTDDGRQVITIAHPEPSVGLLR